MTQFIPNPDILSILFPQKSRHGQTNLLDTRVPAPLPEHREPALLPDHVRQVGCTGHRPLYSEHHHQVHLLDGHRLLPILR